jgi:hypothetical protein
MNSQPDQSESARSDRMVTAMQQTGQTHIVGTLAEAVAVCDTLGIDPRHVIVYGRLMLEERPRVAFDEGQQ